MMGDAVERENALAAIVPDLHEVIDKDIHALTVHKRLLRRLAQQGLVFQTIQC